MGSIFFVIDVVEARWKLFYSLPDSVVATL